MIEWSDQAIVLSARPYGENKILLVLFTASHGRHAGLVHGGRRNRSLLEPGNLVKATWKARLSEHLGTYSLELIQPYAASFLEDAVKLLALQSACALTATALPEREAHPGLFDAFLVLLSALEKFDLGIWGMLYLRWELGLLKELGFALDQQDFSFSQDLEDLEKGLKQTGQTLAEHVFSALNKQVPDVRARLLQKIKQ